MEKTLNVVALISGGKDSFFSLLHCIRNGHNVIALANLHPPIPLSNSAREDSGGLPSEDPSAEASLDDLDSFMYQTAGHNLAPLYAEALDLPIYRVPVHGTAVNTSKSYSPVSAGVKGMDETECLTQVLKSVMDEHPKVNAVSSGAILSTYQRTRVESVAIRLGLIPLSYLWQYPSLPPPSADGLLDDMAAVGFDVRLIKVASGGLDQDLLWRNLMETAVRRKVRNATLRFGGSLLGEGGEYETIVLDGPSPVWKKRIDVDDTYVHKNTEAGSGGTAMVTLDHGAGKLRTKAFGSSEGRIEKVRHIPLWDPCFKVLTENLDTDCKSSTSIPDPGRVELYDDKTGEKGYNITFEETQVGLLKYCSNLGSSNPSANAAEQMRGINRLVRSKVQEFGCATSDIVFTNIILSSLKEDFATINSIYGQLFDKPNPPARITISAPLPKDTMVMVSFVVSLSDTGIRDGLHVQSRSYWAPANIGPYSQAISAIFDPKVTLTYVAGQIPLVPSSMEPLQLADIDQIVPTSADEQVLFQHRAYLALQHLWRIGTEMKVSWWTSAIAFITGSSEVQDKADIACSAWRKIHDRTLWSQDVDEDDTFDVWDRKYSSSASLNQSASVQHALPDYEGLAPGSIDDPVPGLLVVQANELPRSCDIEWQSLGIAGDKVRFEHFKVARAEATSCSVPSGSLWILYLCIPQIQSQDAGRLERMVVDAQEECLQKVKVDVSICRCSMTIYTPWVDALSAVGAQMVPCQRVWGSLGAELKALAAGVVIHAASG